MPAPNNPSPAASTFRGVLHTGMMGIGGEHTGIDLALDDGTRLEVDPVSGRADAEALNGKRVVVTGTIITHSYVERGQVRMLKADSIKPDGGSQ